MSPTSILLIIAVILLTVTFLAYRIIEALHRIALRIESSNTHVEELTTEISALAEVLSNALLKMHNRQENLIISVEDIVDEIHDEDFYSGSEDIYEKAKELILQERKGSAALIQRRLSIGYARAARILDQLEEEGIIGPARGSRPREILK